MRRRRPLIAAVIAVLSIGAIGAVGAVQAGGGVAGMGFGAIGGGLERVLQSVDASSEQREQIWTIFGGAIAQIGPLARNLGGQNDQLAALLAADTLDRAAFDALRKQAITTADTVSARAMDAFLDAAEVLTPEQRAKLLAKPHGRGRGFGPGGI